MRILVSTTAGPGHFGPVVPFARACREAGHDVLVAAPRSFSDTVGSAGFTHAPFDDVPEEVMGAVFGRLPGLPRHEANSIVLGEVFGRLDAQASLVGVSETVAAWAPDVILREPCELASWAAAVAAGIPQVVVRIGIAAMDVEMTAAWLDPLDELRALAGIDPGAGPPPTQGDLTLSLVPPAFDNGPAAGAPPGSPTVHRHRDGSPAAAAVLPDGMADSDAPLVYVTFGSVAGGLGPFAAIYPAVVEALAGRAEQVLLTCGKALDPASLEPLPRNVRAVSWWPQRDVLPAAAAVIGHGGFGTTLGALTAGVPQLVVPLFSSDQFLNAARVAETGVGLRIGSGLDGVDDLPAALDTLLGEPSYSDTAATMAADAAELADVAAAVEVVEDLAGRGLSRRRGSRGAGR